MLLEESQKMTRRRTDAEFVQEVFQAVGDEYSFLEPYQGTDIKIKCKHNKCSHVYAVSPYKFLRGKRRCPSCAKKIRGRKSRKSADRFSEEFYSLFSGYTLQTEYVHQLEPVVVRHDACGMTMTRLPKALLKHKTLCCTYCEIQSFGEHVINEELTRLGVPFTREYRFTDCRHKKPLPFDFALLAEQQVIGLIEYDGRQHTELPGGYFGGEAELLARKERDKIKTDYCIAKDIPLLRVPHRLTEREIRDTVISFCCNIERMVKTR